MGFLLPRRTHALCFRLLLLSWFLAPAGVRTQSSDVQCVADFGWMSNHLGQTPCLVAAYLLSGCSSSHPKQVNKLRDHFVYPGPSGPDDELADCLCSSVTYSVLQACEVCQFEPSSGPGAVNWPKFTEKCVTKSIASYPRPLRAGLTAVPAWAFQDVTLTNTFDVSAAHRIYLQDLPDTTTFSSLSSRLKSTTLSSSSTSTASSIITSSSNPAPSSTILPSKTQTKPLPSSSSQGDPTSAADNLSSHTVSLDTSASASLFLPSYTMPYDSVDSSPSQTQGPSSPTLAGSVPDPRKNSNVALIVGAVLSGVGLLLVAGILFHLLRRRCQWRHRGALRVERLCASAKEMFKTGGDHRARTAATLEDSASEGGTERSVNSKEPVASPAWETGWMLLYNPDDPTTFPSPRSANDAWDISRGDAHVGSVELRGTGTYMGAPEM
ncbi:hypothetical protein C8Q74DRAFT_1233391 [Fomes fomentarius]|nr:hypothetical protein C8Q74DRAFT_1233391 [Fomes fomentarius]